MLSMPSAEVTGAADATAAPASTAATITPAAPQPIPWRDVVLALI
nr:hypothetical protein [Nocardia tengchongensis]